MSRPRVALTVPPDSSSRAPRRTDTDCKGRANGVLSVRTVAPTRVPEPCPRLSAMSVSLKVEVPRRV
jgi:hypothetical protein